MNNRIGCLTNSGLFSAIVTLVIMTGLVMADGYELFSPGPLNSLKGAPLGGVTSHAEIGGKCSLCHTAPWNMTGMSDQCFACHTNISEQIIDLNSLHGIVFENNSNVTCRSCHPEHKGALSNPTVLKNFKFPHDKFGFSLNKHRANWDGHDLGCQDCHHSDFNNFNLKSCNVCHEQIDGFFMQTHVENYGLVCLECHDGLETYGKSFNHENQGFKLIGKHAELICKDCHIGATTKLDLQSTPQNCYSCHQADDVHTGRLGIACGDCHTPIGWKPAKFDHNLAQFKLEGRHIVVECALCHLDGKILGTPQDCAQCHQEDDEHQGVLGTDCSLCHSANGWKPSTFDHGQSTFLLTGLHGSIACEDCHSDQIFKGTPTECFACHAINDKHNGFFGPDCSACHVTDGWLPSTFNHTLNGFPLTGAHLNLACTRCHSSFNFKASSPVCVSCHGEPVFHAGSFGTNCVNCHTTINWFASYTGPHPSFGEHGGINHEGATCRDCHTVNLVSATCTKCHDSNNPGD